MADIAESKTVSPPACSDRAMRDAAFRKDIRRERSKIAKRVERARVNGNVPDLLRLLIAEIELWTRELKMETLTLFEDTDHGRGARHMMRNPPATLRILPGYIVFPFMVVQDALDVVELIVGDAQAKALANRLSTFDDLRRQFGEAVSGLARTWDDAPNAHLEELVTIDRHRSDLKHAAMDLCRYVDTLASLAAARNGENGGVSKPMHPRASSDRAPVAPEDRLRSLRHTFDAAVHLLDSLPDTELSPTGQPFVKECADAMLAFAAWFGEQTPDDVAIHGNAYRVQYALGGLSGVIDWIALHWSVPFAREIDQEIGELVELADAFDAIVVKAFKVPSKRHELRLQRKPLPDDIYADLEQRIEQIAGLAYRLGGRLQRVAVWASEGHAPRMRGAHPTTQARMEAEGGSSTTRERGWQFRELPDGQTSAYHRELCERYAELGHFDLLTLCGQWRALATGFTDHACQSGHHGAHIIHNAAVDRMTRLIETACADRKVDGVGRLSRCLRRPDDGHLHWALATLDELEAQLRAEASQIDRAKIGTPTVTSSSRDPSAVWMAAETMKCIIGRLMAHAMMVKIGKPSEYDDREKMSRDFRLAEKHGYLLVSVARQLSLDANPLTRILREDRLWEYPVEKDDVAVFRAGADVAERICTEARIWCAEASVDLDAILHGDAPTPCIAVSRTADPPATPGSPSVVPTLEDKPAGSAEPEGPAVVLGRPGMPCRVLSAEKPALTDAEHAVVAALLKAGADGLSKDALESVRASARRILKRLSKDADWAKVIIQPGRTNGRYRLKS